MSAWEYRAPAQFQMGNGTLLATFDSLGEVEQLFAPSIDALQSRVGAFFTRVLIPTQEHQRVPQILALHSDSFDVQLKVNDGCQSYEAVYQHRYSPLRLVRVMGIHPTDPLLLDTWEIQNARAGLLHQSIPWMGNTTSAHCSMFHPSFNGLVHHRGRRWLGILLRGQTQWVRVGHLFDHERARLWDGDRIAAPFRPEDLGGYPDGQVRLGWDQIVQGPATWGAIATAATERVEFLVVCAESERNLRHYLDEIGHIKSSQYFQMTEGMVERRRGPAVPSLERIGSPRVRWLAERSVDVLHALQDARTGALVAAAEVDPHSRLSGGYGYSWPRDGAYLALALGAFGYRERVEHYFRFCRDTQDPSGTWWQRYLATGHSGPSWGRIQIDEPATVIFAAHQHYIRTRDLFWLEKFWPVIEKGLGFLEEFHGAEHPLGLPSHDLWEERMGLHAYSLGAVAAAFKGASELAGELSNERLQRHYAEWGHALATVLAEKFLAEGGAIKRSFVTSAWDPPGSGYWDETPDVSLLGLIYPFGLFQPGEQTARRIVENIRHRLWSQPVGGVLRYERDHYRGGNPWILTTLWLGLVELQLGNVDEARKCFEWAAGKATHLGMLAEQVHRESGLPFWVIPLGWSHAMFLLFAREVLDRGVEDAIWGRV